MPVLGITGGIATGKSSFTRVLQRVLPQADVFDADACSRELVKSNEAVKEQIREKFGERVFNAGKLDRQFLREIVFADAAKRHGLEAILHPVIRERWILQAERISAEKHWLFVDIPLLFETSAGQKFDTVVVVACSELVQIRRLTVERLLQEEMAKKMISAQIPLREKIARANHVIWNDGPLASLGKQAAVFSEYLLSRYG